MECAFETAFAFVTGYLFDWLIDLMIAIATERMSEMALTRLNTTKAVTAPKPLKTRTTVSEAARKLTGAAIFTTTGSPASLYEISAPKFARRARVRGPPDLARLREFVRRHRSNEGIHVGEGVGDVDDFSVPGFAA